MTIDGIRGYRAVATALALTAMLPACASDPLRLDSEPEALTAAAEVQATAGSTFRLRPGQTAAVGGGQILVAFRGVKSDSRCPAGVNCVWAGDAEVILGVATEGGSWSWTSLHTGVEPRGFAAHGYRIRLVDVEPGATANSPISSDRYRALLEVLKQ